MKILFALLFLPLFLFGQSNNSECQIQLDHIDLLLNEKNPLINPKIIDQNTISQKNITEEDLKKEYYLEGDDQIKIGSLYSKNIYRESDQLICFKNLWFPTFSILKTNDDKFVALIAENRKLNESDFLTFIENIKKTAELKVNETNRYTIFEFDFKTYQIKIRKTKSSYRSESSVAVPTLNNEEKKKPSKIVDIEFLIINKTANEKHLNWLNKNEE
ncbi:hypothetical protein [Empedobacter sedimenti]|uniref:hypothetical protein n=1 Tax=Empedobacter sedimenti TaxID=3042610 RepID=UPI0024A6AAD0|nr:hypothetical protein [Empedobacter sedimenti]